MARKKNLDGMGRSPAAPREAWKPEPHVPADPDRVRAVIEKLRQHLSRAPERPEPKKHTVPILKPVTIGHGDACTCEVCFHARMRGLMNIEAR